MFAYSHQDLVNFVNMWFQKFHYDPSFISLIAYEIEQILLHLFTIPISPFIKYLFTYTTYIYIAYLSFSDSFIAINLGGRVGIENN